MSSTIKCVVWDLDGTLWADTALERTGEALPEPDAAMLRTIDALAERGVLSSVASRTDPSQLDALLADPALADRVLAPQLAWHDKSTSLRRIGDQLGISTDALALVDDSPYERAEVRRALPEVLVLAPEEVSGLLASLPDDPAELTAETRSRVARYREEERRTHAESTFHGSREDFLRWCDMRLRLRVAEPADVDRVVELARRTHRLNSSGLRPETTEVADRAGAGSVLVAELTDRFGDYGLVGAALVGSVPADGARAEGSVIDSAPTDSAPTDSAPTDRAPTDRAPTDDAIDNGSTAWDVELLALSCRVAGRGVAQAFLRWVMDRGRTAGAARLRVPLRLTAQNAELRVLFRQCGLRAAQAPVGDEPAVLERDLDSGLPEYPFWLTRVEGTEDDR